MHRSVLVCTAWLLCACGAPDAPAPKIEDPGQPPEAFPTGTDLTWPQIQAEFRADVLVPIEDGKQPARLARLEPVLGSCWPWPSGGILRRWHSAAAASPAEKYAALFLDDKGSLEMREWLRKEHGPD